MLKSNEINLFNRYVHNKNGMEGPELIVYHSVAQQSTVVQIKTQFCTLCSILYQLDLSYFEVQN